MSYSRGISPNRYGAQAPVKISRFLSLGAERSQRGRSRMGASPGLVDFSILQRLSCPRLSAHAQNSDDSRGREGPAFSAAGLGAAPPPDGGLAALAAFAALFGGDGGRLRRSRPSPSA